MLCFSKSYGGVISWAEAEQGLANGGVIPSPTKILREGKEGFDNLFTLFFPFLDLSFAKIFISTDAGR